MKVLITGATGFLGSWIARELIAAGHTARALVRRTSSLANLEKLNVERAEGDVLDRASVERALEGCDAVIHTAGVAHFLPGDNERMYAVNAGSVEIVLGAALAAKVTRAVLTSSTAVMGGSRERRVADESTPGNAEALGIDYFISKLRGERAALALVARGLPLCVLRPVVALGPGDIYHSSATTFLALAKRQLPVYVPGGASFTDARDIARAHVAALERGRIGEVYILGGHNLEIGDMVRRVAKVAGVPAPRQAPFALAYAVAALVEGAFRIAGKRPDLSRQLVKASRLYTWVSSAKAERELAYTYRPFEESLHDTLRFFLQTGRLQANTPELRALAD
ncbi:MAG: NAD-dependent epimerase/dehydratase family protein [Myxococcales bacterium]|nr:NAD-dependent epimerase/dehydratase family protein [Myxococcales bacterium]